ncbi:MAG: GNAT family protein [Kineosporiaceae bacterium]
MPEDTKDLSGWTARARPERISLTGRWCRLEPIGPQHVTDLFATSTADPPSDVAARFRYLREEPPGSASALANWVDEVSESEDPLFFAVLDAATGRCAGRQALMRTDPTHGVTEIGSILWGPPIARTRVATEALYLFAQNVFAVLGYRRLEWKCDARNASSRRAAQRFGFAYEGLFRQHMVVKGDNRDTAWFAIVDKDWPALRARYQVWLDPQNFASGRCPAHTAGLTRPRAHLAGPQRHPCPKAPLPRGAVHCPTSGAVHSRAQQRLLRP